MRSRAAAEGSAARPKIRRIARAPGGSRPRAHSSENGAHARKKRLARDVYPGIGRPVHASSRRSTFSLVSMGVVLVNGAGVGCASTSGEDAEASSDAIVETAQDGPASAFPEAVQILMPNGADYCTGVLVKPDVVATAAHCLLHDASWTTWSVRAPFAPGAPSRTGRLFGVLSREYDDPKNGDVGTLRLDLPITLAVYAELRDIGAAADSGRTFRAVAVGRAREARDGALVRSKALTVRSARADGYPTGLRTEYYSFGGDSGGGLFLLDAEGRTTHDVVGFERQPEPPRLDYFTRVDDALKRLVAQGGVPPAGGRHAPSPSPSASSTSSR
jgi:hypothetical protein